MTVPILDTVGGDLPLPLGGGQPGTPTGALDPEFDVFVAGLALNLHITKDAPYRRETAEWRKQQVDQAPEAGEQTLSTWWLRSQMTFHGGAGIRYLDTAADPNGTTRLRFADSRGVDVWTEGVVRRLPDTALAAVTSARTALAAATSVAESYVLFTSGSQLKASRLSAADTITYTVTGMAGAVKSFVVDGSHYYVATSDGHVFKGPIDNSAPGAAVWDFPAAAEVTLGWVKSRLMAGIDNKVYELAGTGPALPAPLYSHPSPAWRWSAWADSPDAIVAAGAAGLSSSLFAFRLTDASGTPVLAPGVSIAEMPVGETIKSLYLYVGSRLAIGTTAGLRVGAYDNSFGTFSYGPLTVQTDGPVTALCGRGPFLYAGTRVGGEASLLRVDLGTPVDDGPVYAWAPDLRAPVANVTGEVSGLTVGADGLLRFAVQGYGVVAETTDRTGGREAWLRTGRIRYTTVEPKAFRYGRITVEGSTGEVAVSAATSARGEERVYTVPATAVGQRFALPAGPAEWVTLTFTLTGDAALTSYQVLALPAQPRQRLFALPVQLFDRELNRHGRPVGYPGRAKDLAGALEAVESAGDEVTVQCPVLGIDATRVTVERIEFTQSVPPTAGKSYGLGGYANLIFRTST